MRVTLMTEKSANKSLLFCTGYTHLCALSDGMQNSVLTESVQSFGVQGMNMNAMGLADKPEIRAVGLCGLGQSSI